MIERARAGSDGLATCCFVDAADLAHGPAAEWGQVSCGCHPNCGVGTALMINKQTKDMAPVPEFMSKALSPFELSPRTEDEPSRSYATTLTPASAAALATSLPGARMLQPAVGHVGMIVSAVAKRRVWRPLADWLAEA